MSDLVERGVFVSNEYGLWCPNCQESIDESWPVICDYCGYPKPDYDRLDDEDATQKEAG